MPWYIHPYYGRLAWQGGRDENFFVLGRILRRPRSSHLLAAVAHPYHYTVIRAARAIVLRKTLMAVMLMLSPPTIHRANIPTRMSVKRHEIQCVIWGSGFDPVRLIGIETHHHLHQHYWKRNCISFPAADFFLFFFYIFFQLRLLRADVQTFRGKHANFLFSDQWFCDRRLRIVCIPSIAFFLLILTYIGYKLVLMLIAVCEQT